jgi:hypothetical protein
VSTFLVVCESLKRPRLEADGTRFSGSEIEKYWSNNCTAVDAFISYGDIFISMKRNEFIWLAVGASDRLV